MKSLRVTITLIGTHKDFPHNPWPFSSIGSHTNTIPQDRWYFLSFFLFFFFLTKDEPALTYHYTQESTMVCILQVWTNVNFTQYFHSPKVLHLPLTTSTAASLGLYWASMVAQLVKKLPAMQETRVQSLGQEDLLGMAAQSRILPWGIPWTEEAGGLQSMGSQRVGHNWVTKLQL